MFESFLVVVIAAFALGVFVRRAGSAGWPLAVIVLGAGTGALVVHRVWSNRSLAAVASVRRVNHEIPDQRKVDGYVSSQSCRACHTSEYESWHRTYHRTMTQPASPQSVLGDFNQVELHARGFGFLLERRGDEFWSKMWRQDDRGVRHMQPDAQIVMTTGSHHYQVYWVSTNAYQPDELLPADSNRALAEFPFAWLIAEKRWIPREAALIMPPHLSQATVGWQNICIRCHSTHGQPRVDDGFQHADTRVAELGIACEACHGPGEEHVKANANPTRRYRQHHSNAPDPTIVQPERLSAERSSQVCAQCHSISTYPGRDWWDGLWNKFRPGQDLLSVQTVVRPNRKETLKDLLAELERNPDFFRSRYWSDGMVRVSGREYNGLVESKCFEGGKLSCLSCHSMHHGDPNDQLKPGMETDQACLQCHDSLRENIAAHTHHPAESAGSRCYNCHMPHTTYGLLKAIRSHHIDSPRVAATVATGRPNACNQCHADKSLAWTAEYLQNWYGHSVPELTDDQQHASSMLLLLLTGDAGQRALAAWTLGWESAQEASGDDWAAPYLGHLLEDPYPAVRFIAERSLRRLSAHGDLKYDFVGPADQRAAARERVDKLWNSQSSRRSARPELLIGGDGLLDLSAFQRLAAMRDDRDIDLQE
jgi:predicted CXXCH cytochrome family protein